MALRTVQQAEDQKGKPAFLFFDRPKTEDKKPENINIDLNKVMQNLGGEAFVYGTFKDAYDGDPRIKEMVKNFSGAGIQLKTKQDAGGAGVQTTDDGAGVAAAAQQATDVGDSIA